jgi:hypothetical protein
VGWVTAVWLPAGWAPAGSVAACWSGRALNGSEKSSKIKNRRAVERVIILISPSKDL